MIYWKVIYGHRNGSKEVRGFFGVSGGYRNPPGKLMGLMGHGSERGQPTRGGRAPHGSPNWTRGGGGAPLSLSYSLSLSPVPTPEKERGILLGLGVLVGPPHGVPL